MKNNQFTCSVCGANFKSYNPTPTFCSLVCKGQSQSATIDFKEAVILYESGLSQAEVAERLGTSQKAITSLFKRKGYKARVAAKRNQTGANNSFWKGERATYAALHYRVQAQRGKPDQCGICGRTDTGTLYEWANLTGNYQDVTDFTRMCRNCHRQYDKNRPQSSKHVPKTL